jgi:kojibiose phosphorylase
MTEDGFRPGHLAHYESIFALANGYMGVRASLETNPILGDAGFYVAGVYDQVHDFNHEIVNLPCWLGLGINVDGFPVDLRKGVMLEYRRTLDMKQGILFTQIVWRDAGMHTTRFELARLVHQADKHVALQWGTIIPLDYSAKVGFTSSIDAWAVKYASPSGGVRLQDAVPRDLGADGVALAVSTRASGIRVAIATRVSAAGMDGRTVWLADDRVTEAVSVPVKQGEPLAFEKRVAVFTSRDGAEPEALAHQALKELSPRPLAAVVESHTAAWAAIWRNADVRIDGDDRAQKALRFNIFHLASLVNPADDRVSLAAKGLHGNGYNGLVFWDTEIYMLPFYTHTHPAAARALLEYRHHFLDDARKNAEALNRKGAYYPWNSSITGRERPWPGWQEHVGSDIAYGIDWYARATGDDEFHLGAGAEIVLETARYWQSRVEHDDEKGYVITGLMGPDEIHGGIRNNSYTNYLVKWHLQRAVEMVEELRTAGRWDAVATRLGLAANDVAEWRRISDHMYLRFNPELNLHEQFEGYMDLKEKAIDRSLSRMQYTGPVQHSFRPTKVAQQADTVLMYWMFAEQFAVDVRRAGYDYYEPRCSHTSSLSRCIFAAVAAQTGLVEEAYRHFMLSAESDFVAGTEMESESGIHAACMGGTWLAAVTGFGGAWMRGDVLEFQPHLPPHWTRMAFALAWRGVTVEVEITQETLRLRTRSGTTTVRVGGQSHAIGPEWTPLRSVEML